MFLLAFGMVFFPSPFFAFPYPSILSFGFAFIMPFLLSGQAFSQGFLFEADEFIIFDELLDGFNDKGI